MLSRIFISRPRLAAVVSIVITLAGLVALLNIPVAQYPQITPPTIQVSATYPGASAETLADTVAGPIEAAVNGVEDMLYMSSSCSDDGSYSLSVTFAVGTDPDIDQVNLQNRVQSATPRLPREVVEQGIVVRRRPPDMMAAISFYSADEKADQLFLSNYVSNDVKDAVVRLEGVSDIFVFGVRDYSIRVWMDPERLTSLGLTAADVIGAIRRQNAQASVGAVGREPMGGGQQVQFTLQAKGRLTDVEEFRDVVIRSNRQGGLVRVRDVARVELGAQSYSTESMLNGRSSVTMAIYQASNANALETMKQVTALLKQLEDRMPEGIEYQVILDSTRYVSAAIDEIVLTLGLTAFLVVLVVFAFLQDWRATLIPAVAIPVSLIGTFAVLLALGYNANTISLFALIMAIGLVVDDAIVVVENVHRIMHDENLDAPAATVRAMGQVTGPIIATTLVLFAVFVPVGFIPGITGQLYQQFAVTMCTSVLLSAVCALSLSPALCATVLRPPQPHSRGPFGWFNGLLGVAQRTYVATAGWLIRHLAVSSLLLVGVLGACGYLFTRTPTSFLPPEDQGYFFINIQLPESASLARTNELLKDISEDIAGLDGVANVLGVSGFSLLSGRADNVGFALGILEPWAERETPELQLEAIIGSAQRKLQARSTANCFAFAPPPIRGLGRSGGFEFQLQAREGQNAQELFGVSMSLMLAAKQDPALQGVFTTYTANTPHLLLNVDRTRAEFLGVPVERIFATLQAQLGSAYVNDFNFKGRTYQVKVQADTAFRDGADDIERLYVRSDSGQMVPLKSLLTVDTVLGPQLVDRYNQYTSAKFNGSAAAGYSSSQALVAMEQLAAKVLPSSYGYEWSSLSYQERQVGGQVIWLFALALLFSYLFLVGQYESWNIPLSIIVSIPVATLGALLGLKSVGMPLSIYAQIGLVLLVGLAAKNAILIVEFAQQRREDGLTVAEAAVDGAKIRFRPVLMTAFTFILGVSPMVIATGAGAGSRRAIGTTVFSGMLVSTLFGIFLIPALYFIFQSAREKGHAWRERRRHSYAAAVARPNTAEGERR
jgi:hydrophobe/amphiphile efflux-1 (HAE1) family protein